jgi:hypothetical protein
MAPFSVSVDSALRPQDAWLRVTDWPRHARFVPLTTIVVTPAGPSAAGTVFTARTGLGRLGIDDPMEIVEWVPPQDDGRGRCRLEKRGRVVLGWAELTVEPHASGSRTTWREEARPARLPAFADRAATAAGRRLFGRVLRKLLAD